MSQLLSFEAQTQCIDITQNTQVITLQGLQVEVKQESNGQLLLSQVELKSTEKKDHREAVLSKCFC